jgi:hypothetical protein
MPIIEVSNIYKKRFDGIILLLLFLFKSSLIFFDYKHVTISYRALKAMSDQKREVINAVSI